LNEQTSYIDSTTPNPTIANSKSDTKMPVIFFLMLAHLYTVFSLTLTVLISSILTTPSSNFLKIWDRDTVFATLHLEKPQPSAKLGLHSTLHRATPRSSHMSKRRQNMKCTTIPSISEMPMGGMQCSVM
jgi:hypothetical protein